MSDRAARLFARLVVHFPSLGGNDDFARIRAEDWCRVIDRAVSAETVIDGFIDSWTRDQGAPKIGDFQEANRRLAQQATIRPARELEEGPYIEPDPERLKVILAEARAALGPRKRPRKVPLPAGHPLAPPEVF